ncbi:Fis family transcriptional regulator [Oceanisphaera psychrotolerans]|uniref:Fis family transcriptional regulator n=1 Tax=Oceanisphaera psychrotolerans TaxID=1414654 RepID=A0A1J4QCK5_9GAMM|nr:Fis family transcriptional regulator [Oceanisphaera psychrotolerans]OIN07929.1 Fis family transcriptional regulator [Oceanisphaera psychrotolerans]
MRKTDKKIENRLRVELTAVCDRALQDITGFQWLTHIVDYSDFPASLRVVCVFDTNENLARFIAGSSHKELNALIQNRLSDAGITPKSVAGRIAYDTEENCDRDHDGKWADRLR